MEFNITLNNAWWIILPSAIVFFTTLCLILLFKPILRLMIKLVVNDMSSKLLSEKYTQNLAEFIPSMKRFSLLNTIELSLRAEHGEIIMRPLGSPKQFLGFENLMFTLKQMRKPALHDATPIDMSVQIGIKAKKPLNIKIPLMISAMAYGMALSEEAKIALAKASKQLGTVTNSGQGPFLPEEAKEADKYVLQISRWPWGARTDEQIETADMLEVLMGHGAYLGTSALEFGKMQGRAQELGGLNPDQQAIPFPLPPGVQQTKDWKNFIKILRKRANGKPIAIKLMTTDDLEDDLSEAIDLGFDVIVLDGAQGGSHASTPITQDDFGIPTLNALIRARRFLDNCFKGKDITLIIAGGFFTPGQCLKALALGADAIYLATVPLFALAHNQTQKVMPYEPLTTLVYYDSPAKTKFEIEVGTVSVVNALNSMVLEMEEALRALGKSSLKELTPDDLVALDRDTAEVTGVRRVF